MISNIVNFSVIQADRNIKTKMMAMTTMIDDRSKTWQQHSADKYFWYKLILNWQNIADVNCKQFISNCSIRYWNFCIKFKLYSTPNRIQKRVQLKIIFQMCPIPCIPNFLFIKKVINIPLQINNTRVTWWAKLRYPYYRFFRCIIYTSHM